MADKSGNQNDGQERLFRVDDGSVYHFAAYSHKDARARWLALMVEEYDGDEDRTLADFGEPEITRVQMLEEAASIMVNTGDGYDPCPHCSGRGTVEAKRSLLDVWREDQKLPPDRRAHHGALCNSEWP